MKANGGRGEVVSNHLFLTPTLDGGEWLTSCPGFFTPGEKPWYPLNGRLGGPHRWNVLEKRRLLPVPRV
jgi:hypothetical protein